jgi:hypothetical protein
MPAVKRAASKSRKKEKVTTPPAEETRDEEVVDDAEKTTDDPSTDLTEEDDSSEADTESDEDDSDEDPEAERAARAAAQNLPPGSVPEQRPQASQQTDPSDAESDLTKRLRKAGHPSVAPSEPMPQSAYDRASSQAQRDKASEESFTEQIMMGNIAESTKGPHKGRIFAITRILSFADVGSLVTRLAGDPQQLYSVPKEVEGTAIGDERDGERLILNVEDDGLVKQNEAVRGTRAGRRH